MRNLLSYVVVKEEYPLKQGLKPSSSLSCKAFISYVKEEYPLKQGLKPIECYTNLSDTQLG